MSLQVKVGSFQQRATTGTQAITGVGFQPKGLVIWGNYVGANGARSGPWTFRVGLSDGTHHLAQAVNAGNDGLNVEKCESAYAQTKCFLGVSSGAGAFFTPVLTTYGYIASFDADGFTANFELNFNGLSTNATWFYLAIGGSGVDVAVGTIATPATGTATVTGLSFAPTTVIGWRDINLVGPLNGAGGAPNFGVACQCNTQQVALALALANVVATSADASAQVAGSWIKDISTAAVITGDTTVTGFTSDGFTLSYTNAGVDAQYYMAIGGVASNVGTFTQPTATGTTTVPINASQPRAVFLFGQNKVASSVGSADALFTMGAADGVSQMSLWSGSLSGQTTPFKAMETVDFTRAISASTPTGHFAATVNTLATVSAVSAGSFSLDWTQVDGVPRQWAYLVLADDFGGTGCGVVPTPTGVTYPIRRARVFPLPSEKNLRMFLRRLELLVQAGVGLTTGQGSDPTFTVELSRDGGMTYGTVYVRTPGRLGDYAHRAFINQLGNYRNGTVRIAMSDPVLWAILDAFGDLEPGTNWARN